MDKEAAIEFFGEFFLGKHHIPATIHEWGEGWCINISRDLATFDFDDLTRLVFLAHDRCVRVSVSGDSGPRMIRICIWQRNTRSPDGAFYDRHPTIEQALEIWRKHYPASEVMK